MTRFPFDPTAPGATLAGCEAAVHAFLPAVEEITAVQLAGRLASDPPILLDIRAAAEHAVGHIAGARHGPLTEAERLGTGAIVLFCSVGLRSGRAASDLLDAGVAPSRVRNLRGGLFRWHRLGLPMVDAAGPTCAIHPFDERWERLLQA